MDLQKLRNLLVRIYLLDLPRKTAREVKEAIWELSRQLYYISRELNRIVFAIRAKRDDSSMPPPVEEAPDE